MSRLVGGTFVRLRWVPMGGLCGRVGAKRLMVLASTAGTTLVVPLMWNLTNAPSLASLLVLQCTLCVCLAVYVPSIGPFAATLFPVPQRALGIGVGYNVGVIVFGAFAP